MKGKHGIYVLVAALVGALVVGCAPAAPAPAPAPTAGGTVQPAPKVPTRLEKVRLHNPGMSGTYQYFLLGKEKGFFGGEGVELEPVVMKSGLAVPALLSGEVDYTAVAGSTLTAAAKGVPIKMVMGTVTKVDFFLVVRPDINTAQDLRGKTVAGGTIGDSGYIGLMEILKAKGVADPEKEITWVNIPSEQRIAAMKGGSVSAMMVKANVSELAKTMGYKEMAFTGDYVEALSNGLSTTDEKLKQNPDQVKRMIKATIRSMAYYRDNSEEIVSFIMKNFEMDRPPAEGTWKAQVKSASPDGGVSEKSLQAAIDLERAAGGSKEAVPIEKVTNFGPLRQAQKELGLPVQAEIKLR
ncbi:MAG: ABC transporter substrate-binding protein [Chloroflexi bacterium]|nr:ABC transporter substrate-binding protein [Chloroflexota bacterium]